MAYNVAIRAYGASTTLTVGGDTAPAVIGAPSSITVEGSGEGSVVVGFAYATVEGDSVDHYLIYIGTSGSPDWETVTTYDPGVIQSSYSTIVATLLTGNLYAAVRAIGTTGLTADSSVTPFFYDPSATVAKPTNLEVVLEGSADVSWSYSPVAGDVLQGFLVYVGQHSEPDWNAATNVGLAGGTALDSAFSSDIATNLKSHAYVAVRAYGSGNIYASSDVVLATTSQLSTEQALAAQNGMDLIYIAKIIYGGEIGPRYYSNRATTRGGIVWEPKLIGVPEIHKRLDPNVARVDALNDAVTIRLQNSPEGANGSTDNNRVETLLKTTKMVGIHVELGVMPASGSGVNPYDFTDGMYTIDQVVRRNKEIHITCVDRMLQPGEKMIGAVVTAADWPVAPTESLNLVRGPVFGKVDGLPLVPVEVGMHAVLASGIDDVDTIIYLSTEDVSLWPSTGWVEIGDEIVYYTELDTAEKRLGSVANPCTRGMGFPATTPASHNSGSVVYEFYSGRIATTNGALGTSETSIVLTAPEYLPAAGVVRIDNEYIAYVGKSGNTLTGCVRGWAAPTLAKVHDLGTPVRTFPTGPGGQPRYRYVVGEGQVSAISNFRVLDESGAVLPYSGGSPVLSQVTGPGSGTNWAVVDLPARPRFEKFESSGSQVPLDWIFETNGDVDGEGVATTTSFLRWRAGTGMSSEHVATWPRAVDLEASTRAVILEAEANKNIFSVEFDASWDTGANHPRQRYGRFRDARLRLRVQYDRQTTVEPEYEVYSNGLLFKSGVFKPPTMAATTGNGSVTGSQTLPATRWNTQLQRRDVRFSFRTTDLYSDNSVGYWIDPWKHTGLVPGGLHADHTAAISGDTRTFLSGAWYHSPGEPAEKTVENPGLDLGDLELYSNDAFPDPESTDIVTALVFTLHNPTGLSSIWTGWDADVYLYPNADFTGTPIVKPFGITSGEGKRVVTVELTEEGYPVTWAHVQSIKVGINQWRTVGFTTKGATVGDIAMAVEYYPDVEGQRVGTIVDGSYFSVTGTSTPSAVYDQVISLGAVAKQVGRDAGVDPWHFFSSIVGTEGMRVMVKLPTTGNLRFAVADIWLELDYDSLQVVYDGTVLADADGRTGTPVGGGSAVLLENPVDIAGALIDGSEFYNFGSLTALKDSTSWNSSRSMVAGIGWKMARAITSQVPLRELLASLCAESRLQLIADGLRLYLKARFDEPLAVDSVRLIGVQDDPGCALVNDDVPILNQVTDVSNVINYHYRLNYVTGEFRAVIEETDSESVALYGKRNTGMNLEWHQSARGYATGIAGQDEALAWLTEHVISRSARLWDYATVELPASAAEDLQRLDVVTLNYPRSGYTNTPAWVISKKRLANPMRWEVVLQL